MRRLIAKVQGISIGITLLCFFLIFGAGCMNVRGSESINTAVVSKDQFLHKKLAILPVKLVQDQGGQYSSDSLISIRVALNEKLDEEFKKKLSNSTIISANTSADILNDKDKLGTLDDLAKAYSSTGFFDKRVVASLCSMFKSDYIIFPWLRAQKMSVGFLGKGFGASLEVMIIDKNGETVWGGVGEYKRGGIYGFGSTDNKAAAEELIGLALAKF
jgi:hypothetical protein